MEIIMNQEITSIRFLPSVEGTGFHCSIYRNTPPHDEQGWSNELYGQLFGVAIEPEDKSMWAEIVRNRLEKQGVVFLSRIQAQSYIDSEGVYWAWKMNYADTHGLQLRDPKFTERLIWNIFGPPMPVNEKLQKIKASSLSHN
jgi:hypothetical protein